MFTFTMPVSVSRVIVFPNFRHAAGGDLQTVFGQASSTAVTFLEPIFSRGSLPLIEFVWAPPTILTIGLLRNAPFFSINSNSAGMAVSANFQVAQFPRLTAVRRNMGHPQFNQRIIHTDANT